MDRITPASENARTRFDPSAAWFREQLLDRRRRISAAPLRPEWREAASLIHEIDAALARIDAGGFGHCERCDGTIEQNRLLGDPLTRVCLECLSAAQQRALERDLELAAVAQRALLPPEQVLVGGWEIAHRYRPLGPVSGDYCDALSSHGPDGAVHFVLGDVSGKGFAASILMAHLQAVFRSLVSAAAPLSDLVGRANRILCAGVLPSSFSTLLLGRLLPDGVLEICNAGHCPPLLSRRGEVTAVEATGMPLGLFSEAAYRVERFRLSPGDGALLYTDGLSEATNPAGEPFGVERLEAVARRLNGAPAGEELDRCLDELSAFQGSAALHDDLTVMIIRRRA